MEETLEVPIPFLVDMSIAMRDAQERSEHVGTNMFSDLYNRIDIYLREHRESSAEWIENDARIFRRWGKWISIMLPDYNYMSRC